MSERATESVPGALAGERLDRIVALMADVTRSRSAQLIDSGDVTVNGQATRARASRPTQGDEISYPIVSPDTEPVVADPGISVSVVYEDPDCAVVDKPAGLVVHPAPGRATGTLVNGLIARYPEIQGVGEAERPGIVHRLDVGTSGLLVVARTPHAYDDLVHQIAARSVRREYLALVSGAVESDSGLIDAPIGRSPTDPTKMAVVADGRPARTRYETVARIGEAEPVTVVRCRLETGRTHQIRVHLASIGHPVLGDRAYGGSTRFLDRPFLHASTLGFDHPVSGRPLSFESALPEELSAVLTRVRAEQR